MNLTTAQQNELAKIRRDLKAESKNELVRAVLRYILKEVDQDRKTKQTEARIQKLEAEAELAEGFIKQHEAAFQAYVEAENARLEADNVVDMPVKEAVADEPA